METILETVVAVGVFVAGVVARLGIVFVMMMAVLVPVLAAARAVRGIMARALPPAPVRP